MAGYAGDAKTAGCSSGYLAAPGIRLIASERAVILPQDASQSG